MSKDAADRLNAALATAMELHVETMGVPVRVAPELTSVEDPRFWAFVEPRSNGFVLEVSTGLVEQTAGLWNAAYADPDFLSGAGHPIASDANQMCHLSLVWLMLHELHHIELNHFGLLGGSGISETRNAPQLKIARRGRERPTRRSALPAELLDHLPLCLELQADHDAFEMLLDAYSADEWESLRHRAMAASAMIVLIERQDAKNGGSGRTHPKAATRIFQLLGHVVELPLVPAQVNALLAGADAIDPNDLPDPEEQKAYERDVAIPAFFDAVHLARISGASTIRDELGDPQEFFGDIGIAKSQDLSRFANLKTVGANEWAKLVLSNEQIKPLQDLPDGWV